LLLSGIATERYRGAADPGARGIIVAMVSDRYSRILFALAFVCGGIAVSFLAANVSVAGSGASGVRGIVLVGPTCPFVYPGRSCPDRPLAGVVVEAGGRRVVTGTDGRFRIKLAPGRYTLSAANPHGLDRIVRKRVVTVATNRFSFIRLNFDSGIR
jgi:hypothetical protein